MTKKIDLLSKETVSKIAAGEVVERPASVVKELIENSLDAGADSIEVELVSSGLKLIRVADNGSGISKEDSEMAFKRHATSKISEIEDLEAISTFGFRGEALYSISSVSKVTLTTKREDDPSGNKVHVEGGVMHRVRPAARDKGTTVEVKDLFYNVPARRKFLKKGSSETNAVVETVSGFILSCERKGFKLTCDDRCYLNVPAGMGLPERIGLILGKDVPDGLIRIDHNASGIEVGGFISMPSFTRKDRRGQIFFVNKRRVDSKVLSDSLYGAYRSLLERGRFPYGILFIGVAPENVDVNIHPAKSEVKFRDDRSVRETLINSVMKSFRMVREQIPEDNSRPPAEVFEDIRRGMTREESGGPKDMFLGRQDENIGHATVCPETLFPEGDQTSFREETLKSKDIFQIAECYIGRVFLDHIEIIDQHAAHERILYEAFSRAGKGENPEGQGLLFPLKLELSTLEAENMDKALPILSCLGFEIEPFGERSFVVRSVPAIIKFRDVGEIIRDALSDVIDKKIRPGEDYSEKFIKIISCRSAVKAGKKLSSEEMEELICLLNRCELPFTCPHGRPTVLRISVSELEKRFRRV